MKKGNIFTSQCDTIVNTVNCQGVMGAGIALEFKLRYPEMFEKYQTLCKGKHIQIGKLWNYTDQSEKFGFKHVLNLPTKDNWKLPSKREYLELALQKFVGTYKKSPYTSVAFPVLGAGRGGLNESEVIELMHHYLADLDIDIEIWQFDSEANDDLYSVLKHALETQTLESLRTQIGLTEKAWEKVYQATLLEKVNSISAIGAQPGIGEKTLDKLICFCASPQVTFNQELF
ncbi:Appr-1-p processing protein [Aliivibrio fischeri]|uniref:macro domain-containing protein n=1 Tax=Aliivibrio fischeri TaxID=668 RepID=UPI0012D9158E|nr:macro domain-containing protein [Aliivibrio fischeri]MUK39245.1 Appr-1-p processing protein [Aliivibrio fischeri]MUL08094.1 Appr-1-p processing protein [Aliivibrio fischeri]